MRDEISVIDLSPLWGDDARGLPRVAAEIGHACREIGFLYIKCHGIDERAIADLFAASRRFFALPLDAKVPISITNGKSDRGYVGFGEENLDPERPGDAKEAFNVGRVLVPDDPDVLAGKPFHALNQWPDLSGFQPVLIAYLGAMQLLCEHLHRAFALDLGLPP